MTHLFYCQKGSLSGHDAAYKLLGCAYNALYGTALPMVEKTPMGKPFFPAQPQTCFSLSHSKALVLCAIGESPVGADIEVHRPVLAGVAQRVCTDQELAAFDFFQLWTLKESYLKLVGDTHLSAKSLLFSRRNDAIVTPDQEVSARLFETLPGCTVAVCVRGGPLPAALTLMPLSKIHVDT